MKTAQDLKICLTREIPNPNQYIVDLDGQYADFAFNEERASAFKGKWRDSAFGVSAETPLDLEIGTGNGYFFEHYAVSNPGRCLVGLEIKYKPLIQTIKRALRAGARNMRIARYHASLIQDLFGAAELNNVYIFFPDPWIKKRWEKNRLIQPEFLSRLFKCQKPGSFVEFKTDNADYFHWTCEVFKQSPYRVVRETWDLHNSEWNSENFQTHFEKLWTGKGLKTHMLRAIRD